jgi:hypothetical protein
MGRAVRGGHRKKVFMSEGEDLRIDRVAHQVEPWTCDVRVVPHLLSHTAIGDDFLERDVVPEIGMRDDHRHRLEVSPAGCLLKTRSELRKSAGTLRDETHGCRRTCRAAGEGHRVQCQRSKAEKSSPSSGINSHSLLLEDRASTASGRPRMILKCPDGNFAVAYVALVIAVGEPCCDFSQITPRDWLAAQCTERLRNGCPAIHHDEFHLLPPNQGHRRLSNNRDRRLLRHSILIALEASAAESPKQSRLGRLGLYIGF